MFYQQDAVRPYITEKTEAHPDIMGDGRETVQFFQDHFGFTGQEVVAIMGAHTFGRLGVHNSLMRYVWTSKGTEFFNNDYYKMITDDTRWYFNDDECTKVWLPVLCISLQDILIFPKPINHNDQKKHT